MSNRSSVTQNLFFDAEAVIRIDIIEHPVRIEECHGRHEFSEDEEVGRELEGFKILLDSGEELDIISVLTEEMKQKILDCI